jgi:hypothetical protein
VISFESSISNSRYRLDVQYGDTRSLDHFRNSRILRLSFSIFPVQDYQWIRSQPPSEGRSSSVDNLQSFKRLNRASEAHRDNFDTSTGYQ